MKRWSEGRHPESVVEKPATAAPVVDVTVRKLYRVCVDCVRKLDQSTKDKSVTQVVSSESIAVRNRLRETCEQLMFLHPAEYGRKAEELIWRKCFYEPIQLLRSNRDSLTLEQQSFALLLLTAGCGHYHSFLLRLQQDIGAVRGLHEQLHVFDFGLETLPSTSDLGKDSLQQPPVFKWAHEAVLRSLIYLGDLARYQQEFDESCSSHLAQHYYNMAVAVKPDSGMPYNQLGTLFSPINYGCDAVYFYMRCIYCTESFDGAQGNLDQVLRKNEKLYTALVDEESDDALGTRKDLLRKFMLSFLHLIYMFYLDDADCGENAELGRTCQSVLPLFEECLLTVHYERHTALLPWEDDPTECVTPEALSVSILLRFTAVQLMVYDSLQDRGSGKLATMLAFSLSVFSMFVNNLLMRLARRLPSLTLRGVGEEEARDKNELKENFSLTETETVNAEVPNGLTAKSSKRRKRAHMLRRRTRKSDDEDDDDNGEIRMQRRMSSSSVELASSDDESNDRDDESDGSNELLDADATLATTQLVGSNGGQVNSTSDASVTTAVLTSATSSSAGASQISSPVPLHAALGATVQPGTAGRPAVNELVPFKQRSSMEQLHELTDCGILAPIKIFMDWLRCNATLIVSISQSSQTLWTKVAELLDFLPKENEIMALINSDQKLSSLLKGVVRPPLADWNQSRTLIEDVALRGVPALAQLHGKLDYTLQPISDPIGETIVRLFSIQLFGHFLVRLNVPGFTYDASRQSFLAMRTGLPIVEEMVHFMKRTSVTATETKERLNREDLQKKMARLRLQVELDHLEREGWIPVFLVPDLNVFAQNRLGVLKQLAAAHKFVIVIGASVMQDLDRLKTTNANVRESMRWLDEELAKRKKFIRVQKPEERVELRSLRKENCAGAELIECCAHLVGKLNNDTAKGSVICTILTGGASNSPPVVALEKALESVELKGVNVSNINVFCNRYKTHRKKDG